MRTGFTATELSGSEFGLPARPPADQFAKLPAVREIFDDGTVGLPAHRLSTIPGIELAAPGILERLWFGPLVARASVGQDLFGHEAPT